MDREAWCVTEQHQRQLYGASQVAQVVKNPFAHSDVRDVDSIPESGRFPEEGHGNHSTILTWRVPCTEKPEEL